MSNIITHKWLLNRRHLLRGLGAAVALPLLDCMRPLLGATPTSEKPRRSVFVYIPNGVNVLTWQITKAGRDYELSEPLKSLERHRSKITPISGLHHPNAIGSAHECEKVWLTAARINQKVGGFRNTISCDQLISESTSRHTRIPSLELANVSGNQRTLAWSRDGIALPAEDNPRQIFDRLFEVEHGGVAARRNQLERRLSVLDLVRENADGLRRRIGRDDRTKLNEYLESVREVEVRTERLEAWLNVPKPKVDAATKARLQRNVPKTDAGDYYRTMYDLIVLALQTDMTRVVTFQSGNEANGLALPEIGIPQDRHGLSHHNGDPEQMRRLSQADAFIVDQFAYFLDRLQGVADGDGMLLDRTMVLLGSGMSYGHSHGNANLPTILAGGSGLGLRHGQHIDYNLPVVKQYQLADATSHYRICSRPLDDKARLSNLLLTMVQKMEVPVEKFVDSLGPVSEVGG
ncbi:DUF1552 domain-containing protein [Planctomicrobium sp. SH664]|uniref:DUF1552 domain-containing protein n=1 Tax=Planctomicrobium sp. SH664 TaxID=3448125 RepID=UPI003F5C1590